MDGFVEVTTDLLLVCVRVMFPGGSQGCHLDSEYTASVPGAREGQWAWLGWWALQSQMGGSEGSWGS